VFRVCKSRIGRNSSRPDHRPPEVPLLSCGRIQKPVRYQLAIPSPWYVHHGREGGPGAGPMWLGRQLQRLDARRYCYAEPVPSARPFDQVGLGWAMRAWMTPLRSRTTIVDGLSRSVAKANLGTVDHKQNERPSGSVDRSSSARRHSVTDCTAAIGKSW